MVATKEIVLSIHPVAILIGLAAGWQWSGMRTILASAIDPLPATTIMLGAIVLLTTAVGPWLPERVINGVARIIGRRSRRAEMPAANGIGTFWMLRAIRDRDEPLMWLVLAVLASVAGLVSLLTLIVSGPLTGFYRFLLDQFFWTNMTLTGLEWMGTTLLIGTSWIVNGLVVATLSPVLSLRSGSHRSPPVVSAGVLIGLGLAWVSQELMADRGYLSGNQFYLIGILPMFLLAGISAWMSQKVEKLQLARAEVETEAPEVGTSTESLIWLALVVWGVGSVLVGFGFLGGQWLTASKERGIHVDFSCYVLILGLGMTVASYYTRGRKRSASGCGMALWGAGLGTTIAATLMSFRPTGWLMSLVQVTVLAIPIGYALHYVERAWLARVGSETLGFAQMASAVLAGLAVGLITGYWWALPILGSFGVITAGALMMLAFGGLMQIYEEECPVRIQHQRLALIFASLALAVVILPFDAQQWARWERSRVRSDRALVPEDLPTDAISGNVRNICLINVDPVEAERSIDSKLANIDVIPIFSVSGNYESITYKNDRMKVVTTVAYRAFRLERRRYDLIYQRYDSSMRIERFTEYSTEWFNRLAEHVIAGGEVIVDVPLSGMTIEAIKVIASTFTDATSSYAYWTLIGTAGRHTLRLRAKLETVVDLEDHFPDPWHPVNLILQDRQIRQPHSVRCDQITRFLKKYNQNTSYRSLLRWLRQLEVSKSNTDKL
ncbi:MAG: hypothetical protein JSV03_12695 [Planctomycetota bacterium]|nr:MAG: hypothetical protein JSV03_12695 [Planctomycetota bacterium]